jgi:tyrosine-protein phosphatase SIW14
MRLNVIKKGGRWLSFALVAICLAASLTAASNAQDEGRIEPRYKELPNFHQVNTRLYRGGQPKSGGIQKLASLGVNTIINLRDDDERAEEEKRDAEAVGLHYFNVPFARLGRPTDEQVERVLALINSVKNGVVFAHCAHGEDRTGLVIAIYRISHDRWNGEQARREAKRYGIKFWQRGMLDYISDYYRDHPPRDTGSSTPSY